MEYDQQQATFPHHSERSATGAPAVEPCNSFTKFLDDRKACIKALAFITTPIDESEMADFSQNKYKSFRTS